MVTKNLPFLNYIETLLIDRKNMRENDMLEKDEIFSKVLRAGRRTYFFDVRATKADDYYITITESKKFTEEDGSFHFKKHKIYLYKEDFAAFTEILEEMTSYVLNNKGEEVISERHQKDFKKEYQQENSTEKTPTEKSFTDIDFDDI
ncbi:uncharacterized protein DUF3276 [Flavobacterium dankookense]|uniref:Uncharacterized protein DUF3276 n=2 Tax=Flavobacterium dankookense TaxID=706186 RepID=A0A4R6Q606_9FLAO|nr:uncharacterized protein DUF3276 [Flavobacterium dankookense]